MRRSALPRHVPPRHSKSSFGAKYQKNFGFTPVFLPTFANCRKPNLFGKQPARIPSACEADRA